VYLWELDGSAEQELAALSPTARIALAAFMDAVVIVDALEYQRRGDETGDPPVPLRTLHFGPQIVQPGSSPISAVWRLAAR
jgi:hypothetical protein